MSFSTWPGYRPGHEWEVERHPERTRFSRRLGVLEQRFDIASSNGGQSDTFVRLRISLRPAESGGTSGEQQSIALARLFAAWTRLRAVHPLLDATIHEDPRETISGCSARRFVYEVPTPAEALQRAHSSFLVTKADDLEHRTDEIQDKYILNGDRVLLDEKSCLARLVFVLQNSSPAELGFFLVISHVISDGVSVFKLVNELFANAAQSEDLPRQPTPRYLELDDFLKGGDTIQRTALQSETQPRSRATLPDHELLASLPLSTEDHYPPLPLADLPSEPSIQPIEAPRSTKAVENSDPASLISTAQKRWVWAIARTIILVRQSRFPHSLHIPRIAPDPPPIRAKSNWEFLRFDKTTSSKLFHFCKRNGQSPSMLLYSMLSLATANLFASLHPPNPYHPILVGFPFSARRFLERSHSSVPSSDPSSDLAIRITFGSIHLPNLALNLDDDPSPDVVRSTVLKSARLAKTQFDRRLAPDRLGRTVFLSVADGLNMDRLLLRYGRPRPPWNDPKTCINASMIGDIDRILPTRFKFDVGERQLELRLSDLQIGTRLHLGEGNFNEGFTYDGMLQLSMGTDDQVIDPEHIRTIMQGVEKIGKLVAQGEE